MVAGDWRTRSATCRFRLDFIPAVGYVRQTSVGVNPADFELVYDPHGYHQNAGRASYPTGSGSGSHRRTPADCLWQRETAGPSTEMDGGGKTAGKAARE